MFWGLFLIIVGGIWLLSNLGYLPSNVWGIFWPLLIIAFGVSAFFGKRCLCCWGGWRKNKEEKKKK